MAKPIQTYVLSAAVKKLKQELTLGKPVLVTQQSDYMDAYKASKSASNFGEMYFLRIDGYEPGASTDSTTLSGSIRPYALAHNGLTTNIAIKHLPDSNEPIKQFYADQNLSSDIKLNSIPYTATIVKFLPMLYRCTLLFVTSDTKEQLEFFSRWAFANINSRCGFTLNYEDVSLWCDVVLGSDIMNVGERVADGSQGRYLVFEAPITIGGWFTSADSRDTQKYNLITNFKIGGS